MSTVIRVNASSPYDVILGSGLLSRIGEIARPLIKGGTLAVITDSNVDALYASEVFASLKNAGFNAVKFVFPAGEKSKNISTYAQILDFLAASGLTRKDGIVALGGGVTGDLAGFAAATYLRGIDFIQVPTTLLSIIDSSVGGKTGIDLKAGKNLAGAFYQPVAVIADTQTLNTLPEAEIRNGLGEYIKYAILAGGELWEKAQAGGMPDEAALALCIKYKSEVVEKDEREAGLRRLLNLGHTPAHAIEKLSDYTVPHGIAVAEGLSIIAKASQRFGLSQVRYKEIIETLEKYGLPVSSPFSAKEIAEASLNDKKSDGEGITLIMIKDTGDCLPLKVKHGELEELFK